MTETTQVMGVLRKIGFAQIRVTASHRFFKRADILIVVPYHTGYMNRKTLQRILQLARISPEEYLVLR